MCCWACSSTGWSETCRRPLFCVTLLSYACDVLCTGPSEHTQHAFVCESNALDNARCNAGGLTSAIEYSWFVGGATRQSGLPALVTRNTIRQQLSPGHVHSYAITFNNARKTLGVGTWGGRGGGSRLVRVLALRLCMMHINCVPSARFRRAACAAHAPQVACYLLCGLRAMGVPVDEQPRGPRKTASLISQETALFLVFCVRRSRTETSV